MEPLFYVDGKPHETAAGAATDVISGLDAEVAEGMKNLSRLVLQTLNDIFADIAKRHGGAWPTGNGPWGTSPDRLSRRSGGGLESIRKSIKVEATPVEVVGSISTGTLTVHETGAVITAKHAKYLTIPFKAALDGRGVPLKPKARDWDNTFIARSKAGNLIIFRKEVRGKITPLYLLKQSVTIPKRLGLGETFDKYVSYFDAKAIAAIERQLP